MALLEDLKKDHKEVKQLLDQILESEDSGERKRLFEEMATSLLAHAHAEDKVFYSALKKEGGDEGQELALEGEEEHKLVEQLVETLRKARRVDSHSWQARCKVLKDLVEHHVEEEESEFFDKAEEEFDKEQLEQMGQKFEQLKQKEMQ